MRLFRQKRPSDDELSAFYEAPVVKMKQAQSIADGTHKEVVFDILGGRGTSAGKPLEFGECFWYPESGEGFARDGQIVGAIGWVFCFLESGRLDMSYREARGDVPDTLLRQIGQMPVRWGFNAGVIAGVVVAASWNLWVAIVAGVVVAALVGSWFQAITSDTSELAIPTLMIFVLPALVLLWPLAVVAVFVFVGVVYGWLWAAGIGAGVAILGWIITVKEILSNYEDAL